jgi:membrane fusion protein, multidrug efflux system
MKKFILLFISLALILLFNNCGKGDGTPADKGDTAAHKGGTSVDKAESSHGQKGGKKGKRGQEGKGKKDKIDLNSPDIPERMKQAIKSGKISKERAMQMLAKRRGGGNAPTVKVEEVTRQKINAFLVLNGVVEPERLVEVHSRLSAYVKKIIKEEGDFVKKNDVLALLDDTEIKILHRQSQIQLEQASLTLKDEEINYKRSQELKETNMISDQDFQASEAAYNKAKLDHQTRLENFKDLELQLSYTRIKSPAEGYVTQRSIEVGSRVSSNQPVYRVEDFSPLLVKVYVPTSDVVHLQKGMESEVATDVLSGMTFNGNIKLINPRIDVQSGTVKVTVEVFDSSGKLKPGMFVETKILISNTPDAIVIPKKCVSYKQNEAFVFIFKRERGEGPLVFKRPIKTGISEGDNIQVLEGLEAGEKVVVVGVESLKDKMKVKVVH